MATVLILSCPEDTTAKMVTEKLRSYPVRVVSFDTADFPMNAELTASPGGSTLGTLRTPEETVDLDDVVGVLYRRPAQFRLPGGMMAEHRTFARVEARHGFGGVLTSIEARWVNHPSAIGNGNFKPRQLQAATAVGMIVPRTMITNNPEHARKFACEIGQPVIYKVFEPPILPDQKVIFTSVVDPNNLDDPAIRLTAHLFQEQIPKEFDARVTMIADKCFGVAIHANSDAAKVDFRADYDAVRYTPLTLPSELPGQLRAYLDKFGLTFARSTSP